VPAEFFQEMKDIAESTGGRLPWEAATIRRALMAIGSAE
jgi:hypothetical protein